MYHASADVISPRSMSPRHSVPSLTTGASLDVGQRWRSGPGGGGSQDGLSSFFTFRRGSASQSPKASPSACATSADRRRPLCSGNALRGGVEAQGSISSVDTVEMVQMMLQSSLTVAGNGAVRFSPITAGSITSGNQGPLLEPPMAPARSATPSAACIQQSPWAVLTTSGATLKETGKQHCDDVHRFVDNASDDLIVYRGMILMGWLQVLKLLGTGTFGQVFLCRDLRFTGREEGGSFSIEESYLNNSQGSAGSVRSRPGGGGGTADWGGEDFQYYQCAGIFLPDGDARQRPLTPRLVAVKVVKSIASYELQSILEAEILVRAADASERDAAQSSNNMIVLEDTPLTIPVNNSGSTRSAFGVARGGVAEILAHGLSYGHHCLVLNWYGENLYEYMKRQQPEPQRLPGTLQYAPSCHGIHIERIRVVGRQLLEALAMLHDSLDVCHGDVKPENIMLDVPEALRCDSYIPAEERILMEEERLRASSVWNIGSAYPESGNNTPPPAPLESEGEQVSPSPKQQQASYHSPLIPVMPHGSLRDGGPLCSGASAISTALAAAASLRVSDTYRSCPPRQMATHLVDLGSAFAANQPMFPYIQSRYYRAPEVVLGGAYSTPIDIWSAGCVLAEMLLGLPLLPGLDNYHQLLRITEMFGPIPSHVLAQGKDTHRYYRWVPEVETSTVPHASSGGECEEPPPPNQTVPPLPAAGGTFVPKSDVEYYQVERGCPPPAWRPYFQFRRLHELVQNGALSAEERQEATLSDGKPNLEVLRCVGHKRKQLYDALVMMLQLDPHKRVTARAALRMPFFANVE